MQSTTALTFISRKAEIQKASLPSSAHKIRQAVKRKKTELELRRQLDEIVIAQQERAKTEENYKKISTELQQIFRNMITAFIIWESVFDENGSYVSFRFGQFNDAYARIANVRYEEVKGRDVFDVWPATEKSWVGVYGAVATTGTRAVFDMYHEPTKGWYHCNAYRPTDSPLQVCVIFEDITDRKRTEEALSESRKQLAEAMDISQLVNWEYDVATGFFTFDNRFYALYGTTAGREGGTRMPAETYAREFVHPDDRHMVSDEVEKALRTTDPLVHSNR